MSDAVQNAPVGRLRRLLTGLGAFLEVLRLVSPMQRFIVVGGLFLSSILELCGMGMIIPLLATASGAREAKGVSLGVEKLFAAVGLPFAAYAILIVVVVGLTLKAVVGILIMKHVTNLVGRISRDFQIRLTKSILEARWGFFISQPLGRLVHATGSEAAAIGECFAIVTTIIAASLTSLLFLTLAALLSWQLLVLIIFITIMMFGSFGRLVKNAREEGKAHRSRMNTHAAQFTDAMIGFKQIRAMGRTDRFALLFERQARMMAKSLKSRVMSGEYAAELQEPVIGILLAFGFFFALHKMALSPTAIMIMSLLLVRTLAVLGPIQRNLTRFYQAFDGYKSLSGLLEQIESHAEETLGTKQPHFERAIKLEGITFGYGQQPVLRNLDLFIPSGKITAISGPSGIGKSTIVDLIVALHQPQSGRVMIDDDELMTLDVRLWRRSVGYVPQEITLFHDTIFNNVALWEEGITADEVEKALKAAGAWDFVTARPDGIMTVVGERGNFLSGGQRQRISIARAILHKPRLLILDEATTGLDPATEAQICERIRDLCRETGLTVMAVSHQPKWREVADLVYRIQDGQARLVSSPQDIAAISEQLAPQELQRA
ncbi:ATP-binding cassette, subfamily C [Arboricoccus pini]|uniref:ATP-binding cassette, subfamily C n=1 Tax=Arboricoccus pini TaxID=1963835 RepID=A0A212QQ83_9PROT|nr:ABC transporter ATP-binding protein [Arboricoccus pini]SNB61577.1 ATP-binding cassette, subfamily C [Arboricoccus pini]